MGERRVEVMTYWDGGGQHLQLSASLPGVHRCHRVDCHCGWDREGGFGRRDRENGVCYR